MTRLIQLFANSKVFSTLIRFYKLIKEKHPKVLRWLNFLNIFNVVNQLAALFIMKHLINLVYQGETTSSLFVTLVICLPATLVIHKINDAVQVYLIAKLSYSLRKTCENQLINKVSKLSLAQLESSEFQNKLNIGKDQVKELGQYTKIGSTVITEVLPIIGYIMVLFYENYLVGIAIILSSLPMLLINLMVSSKMKSLIDSVINQYRYTNYLLELITTPSSFKEIKLLQLGPTFQSNHEETSNQIIDSYLGLLKKRKFMVILSSIVSFTLAVALILYIFFNVNIDTASMPSFALLVVIFLRVSRSLQMVMRGINNISEKSIFLSKYFEVMDVIPNQTKKGAGQLNFPAQLTQGIEFRNVTFKYPGAKQYVFQNFNLTIKAKEKIAIVGENGTGKSTLLKLLLRLYELDAGEILIDGQNINSYELAVYHKNVGIIFQDFNKYELSFIENITFGNISNKNDQGRIDQAIERSMSKNILEKLPEGHQQKLGKKFKNGINLSGGEWQKLAIGRAHMQDSPVLVLDEPSSALDPRSEYEVFNKFIDVSQGKTVIIISHRFSTVRAANRILYMEKGKVIEDGSHDELIHMNSKYKKLYSLQNFDL